MVSNSIPQVFPLILQGSKNLKCPQTNICAVDLCVQTAGRTHSNNSENVFTGITSVVGYAS